MTSAHDDRTPGAVSAPVSEQPLRTAVARVARALEDGDTAGLGGWCAHFCTTWLPPGEAALVELSPTGHRGNAWMITASDETALELCELDLYTHAGPCRACLTRGEAATIPDLSRSPAGFTDFAGHAHDRGFCWSLARPLRLSGAVIGALQLFGAAPHPPDQAGLELAHALATITAGFRFHQQMLQQQGVEVGQLHTALASRVVIEQAKGVIAVRHGIDLEQAFARLRAHARSHRLNIHDVARDVVDGLDIR